MLGAITVYNNNNSADFFSTLLGHRQGRWAHRALQIEKEQKIWEDRIWNHIMLGALSAIMIIIRLIKINQGLQKKINTWCISSLVSAGDYGYLLWSVRTCPALVGTSHKRPAQWQQVIMTSSETRISTGRYTNNFTTPPQFHADKTMWYYAVKHVRPARHLSLVRDSLLPMVRFHERWHPVSCVLIGLTPYGWYQSQAKDIQRNYTNI